MTTLQFPVVVPRWNCVLNHLLLFFLGTVLVSCRAVPDGVQEELTEKDGSLCTAELVSQDALHIVTTTGQIGNTVRLIAGLDTIDPMLWSPEEIAARTVWSANIGDDEPTTSPEPGEIQPTDLNIQVSVMLGPGTDPHLYVPTFKDAELLNSADVIIYNGLHLEAQVLNALHELAKTRCVVAVGDVLYANEELAGMFLHDKNGLVDPHIWNSPALWREAAITIAQTLAGMYGSPQAVFHQNADVVVSYLTKAEDIILDMFSDDKVPVKYLVTAHDAFGYYSALTGLKTLGLQGLSTETEVSAYDIQAIADTIVEQKIPALFVETSVSEDAVRAVQAAVQAKGWQVELGGELYSDALGPAGTEGESYLGMLQHNTVTIFRALTDSVPEQSE